MLKNFMPLSMKNDIQNREDLLRLVTVFYEKLLADPSINYLFLDVVNKGIDHHLEVLVDFWDNILFQHDTYRKNAMQPHLELHARTALTSDHFTTWLGYFQQSVDELFKGDIAFKAKERANSIATVMRIKISQLQ